MILQASRGGSTREKRPGPSRTGFFAALVRCQGNADVIVRTDNAPVHAPEFYRDLTRSYGLSQEFILPHTPSRTASSNRSCENVRLDSLLDC
jgi:hypothetical protein